MQDDTDTKTIDAFPVPVDGNESQIATLERLVDAKARAQVEFSESVGQFKAFGFQRKVSWIATLKTISELKETKAYKGLSLKATTGEVVTCKTWEDFCKAAGFSRKKIEEDLLDLDILGADFLESARQMKLGHRDILKLRKLPEEDRAVVLGNVEVAVGDKTAVIELIDELAQKHAKEKAALEERLETAEKRVDAVVKAETEALEKERDALIKERNELQAQVEAPDWKKAQDYANQLALALDDAEKHLAQFVNAMPSGQAIPSKLELQIEASLYRALNIAEKARDRFYAPRQVED